jgi:streptogramin lyase
MPAASRGEDDETIPRPSSVLRPPSSVPSALDQIIPLGGANAWLTIGWIATFIVALALRLLRLNTLALDPSEAARAYHAWVLFRGQPPVTGETIPNLGALLLLLEGAAFFLFGATDVVARLIPVLAGLAIVALPLALWRWVGAPAALGMAALAAFSPTLVYASRLVSPEIVIAMLSLAAVACLVRLGEDSGARGPAIALGIVCGAAFAVGPSAVTVALTLAIGAAIASLAVPQGAIRRGLSALRSRDPLIAFILAAIVTTALCFTRFLSDPSGIAGVAETLGAWWQLLAGPGSGQPVPLFLMGLVVYEPLVVAFTIVALARDRDDQAEPVAFFAGWALAAFAIWSFSAGRTPDQAVHIALPLVMLAGIGLGSVFKAIAWDELWTGSGGVLALAMLGFLTGLAAVGVLLTRVGERGGGFIAAMPPVAVLCLVVVPLAYLIWRLSGDEHLTVPGTPQQAPLIALFVLALLLGAFAMRSATLLAFYRTDLGTELLAQHTATLGTLPRIEGFLHLARDVGVDEGTVRDPTGSHGLGIAVERGVQWPYVWYFREFPDLSLVGPGAGAATGAQVVIAASDAGLADAGYTVESWPWLSTVPPQYLTPDVGAIVGALLNPSRWIDDWRYLLFRDGVSLPAPAMVTVGLTPELAGQVTAATGPFNLGDHPGSGTEPGQFRDPVGVAVGSDGSIAVVDSGNARVERFAADGTYLDTWGGGQDGVTFTRTENGLGPTGITITPDGITWVADTWGHRVVALAANGQIVQSIGAETIDIGDDPARVNEGGGRFFGPRAIAVTDDAIYVVDTGNERVQKFKPDGTFVKAWGGYGTAPGQLIEPVGIAVGPDGNLYVADSGNARISIFTPNGDPVAQWPVSVWPAPAPGGVPPSFQPYLAFDTAGNLYATASNAGQAVLLGRDGATRQNITEAGNERLAQPVGVAVTPDGDVLFSDVGRDTVLTYVPPQPGSSEELNLGGATASPAP